MADDNQNSQIEDPKRTKSLMGSFKGSFKMAESLLVPGSNKKVVNLDLPGVKLIQKVQYKKQQVCQVCFIGFGKLTRQHHCRICANAVCSSCSGSSINKQRCCDVCAYKYSSPDQQTNKQNILFELEGAAILFVQSRNGLQHQLKKINQETKDIQSTEQSIKSSEEKMIQLQKQLEEMKRVRAGYEQEIAQISQ